MLLFNQHSTRRLRLPLAAGWALLGLLAATRPAAAQSGVELVWDAPAACPQRADVIQRVREIAGDSYALRLGFRANGKVSSVAGRYELSLTISDGDNSKERSFNSKSCVDLAGAAAIVLGLEFKRADPNESVTPAPATKSTPSGADSAAPSVSLPGTQTGVGPEPAPSDKASGEAAASDKAPSKSGAEDPASPPKATAVDASTFPSHSDAIGFFVAPHIGVQAGMLSKPTVPLGVALGGRIAPWSFWLAARYEAEQKLASTQVPDVGARVAVYTLRGAALYGWRINRIEMGLGVTGGLGRVSAQGTGSDLSAKSSSATFGFVGAALFARFFLTEWLTLSATGAAEFNLSRPEIVVQPLAALQGFGVGQLWIVVGPELVF